ncbi:MAG: ABC transporter substrate-binding protein [Colwellia sp.]|nr:ABC transporter substrate-binding protein [Colwellia sp.]
MKRFFSVLIVFVISSISISTLANEVSPYKVINTVGNNLFTRIAQNQQEIEKFPGLMRNIVDEELMPSIDYKYAAYRILGKHLRKTTKEQRAKFVTSIRSYLVRTYANALSQYKNQQVIFEPERDTKGKKIVSVNTKIIGTNRPDINIAFKMRQNKKTKQWKAYDMVVEGISLLSSKQAELSQRIAKQGVERVSLELASIAK